MPLDPRRVLDPVVDWARDTLEQTFEKAASLGRATERRVLDAARALEVPATRVERLAEVPIDIRDRIAERVTRGHASLAAVSCGAAGAVPVGGFFLELAALAELNMVQVDHVARAYGFDIGGDADSLSHLPMGGNRALLLVPILAALEVRALERDGRLESVADLIGGAAERIEWKALSARLATAAATTLARRAALRPLRRAVPLVSGAISAWSSYAFTEAVGKESRTYFRELALGEVVIRGRLL